MRLYVPAETRLQLKRSHMAIEKTFLRLKGLYYFPNMRNPYMYVYAEMVNKDALIFYIIRQSKENNLVNYILSIYNFDLKHTVNVWVHVSL